MQESAADQSLEEKVKKYVENFLPILVKNEIAQCAHDTLSFLKNTIFHLEICTEKTDW